MGTERRARKEKARAGFDQPGEARGAGGGGERGCPAAVFSHLRGGYREGRARLPAAKA